MEISEELLVRFLGDAVSAEEREAVEAWYDADPSHRALLRELYCTDGLVRRIEAGRRWNREESLERLRQRMATSARKGRRVRMMRRMVRFSVAACLSGLLMSAGVFLKDVLQPETFMVRTERAEKTQCTLPDGTRIWLNACSEVTYTSSLLSSQRKVRLRGEAYFEVYRNERKPFVVETEHLTTTVLGTKFNIRAIDTERKVEASLKEGCIELSCGEGKPYRMQPLETVVFDTRTGLFEKKRMANADRCAQWQSGVLAFESATLEEITNSLRRYYDIEVAFEQEELKQELFSGDFRIDQTPDQVFTLLSMTKSIAYKRHKMVYTFEYVR